MLAYIFVIIGIGLAIGLTILMVGVGTPKKNKQEPRYDERKGRTYSKPQAEQVQPAEDQSSPSRN